MKVKKLISLLKKQNGALDVFLFAHDQEPEDPETGDGIVSSVYEVTDWDGKTFVAIHG